MPTRVRCAHHRSASLIKSCGLPQPHGGKALPYRDCSFLFIATRLSLVADRFTNDLPERRSLSALCGGEAAMPRSSQMTLQRRHNLSIFIFAEGLQRLSRHVALLSQAEGRFGVSFIIRRFHYAHQ